MRELVELLEDILDCFFKNEDGWYEHKTLDAAWVPVSEELQDYLEQAQEHVNLHAD